MTCPHNNGGKISNTPYLDPEGWYRPNVLNGWVSYDVDLSRQQCGCIGTFYQVRMPGKDWNGNYVKGGQNDYYCDANKVGGTFCPEFDIMEANRFSFQTTAHKCDAPSSKGYYSNCDGRGADLKNFGWYDGYGPGASNIDTAKKFNVKIDFTGPAPTLHGYTITMTQDDKSIQFKGYSGYSQALSDDMNGHMAYTFSNWGPQGGEWLDGGRCQSACGSDS